MGLVELGAGAGDVVKAAGEAVGRGGTGVGAAPGCGDGGAGAGPSPICGAGLGAPPVAGEVGTGADPCATPIGRVGPPELGTGTGTGWLALSTVAVGVDCGAAVPRNLVSARTEIGKIAKAIPSANRNGRNRREIGGLALGATLKVAISATQPANEA
jgi:hypothetical protein